MEVAAASVTNSGPQDNEVDNETSSRKIDQDDADGMETVLQGDKMRTGQDDERGKGGDENEAAETEVKKGKRKRNRKPRHKQSSTDNIDQSGAAVSGMEPIINDVSQHSSGQHGFKDDRQKLPKMDQPGSAKRESRIQSQIPRQKGNKKESHATGGASSADRPESSRGRKQGAKQKGAQTPSQTPTGKPGPDETPDRPLKKEIPRSSKGRKNNSEQLPKEQSSKNSKTKETTSPRSTGGNKKENRDFKNPRNTPTDKSSAGTKDLQNVLYGGGQTPTKNDLGDQRTQGSEAIGKGPRTPKSRSRNASRTPNENKNFKSFEDYLSLEEVSDGLKRKELLQGMLRINPKNYEESYIDSEDGGADIMISGITARNRALEGDVVVVQLLDKSAWRLLEEDYATHRRKQLKGSQFASPSKSESQKMAAETNPTTQPETALAGQFQSLEISSSSHSATDQSAAVNAKYAESSTADNDNSMFRVKGKAHSAVVPGSSNDVASVVGRDSDETQNYPLESRKDEIDQTVKRLFPDGGPVHEKEGTKKGAVKGEKIPKRFFQKHAKVVYIVEKRHSRACSGHLKLPNNSNATDALFSPKDHRMPRIYIPLAECPDGFLERPGDFETTLFIARLEQWPKTSAIARGHLHRSLGEAGEIEPETEGMLIEYGVDYSEFSEEVIECLPKNLPWTIPQDEVDRRKDFRSRCVFTIDPATARDLDDALSCVPLGDGVYEVGVHIADVSFFVDEGNELDKVAGLRATSVYLVQKVIPMLPRLLCEHLCSLNPNEDKLAFSFLWKLTENGEIMDEWCGRSVIRSCVKMSYNHAQSIIAEPEREWRDEEMPTITNGFSIPEVAQGVLNLNKIAQNLRKKRSEDGALRLDQVKLQFALDKESGLPSGYSVYMQRDSNKLVEEFMLLANMAAAHRINDFNKKTALLRRHPPPKTKMIDDLIDMCSEIGLDVDGSSSKAIQETLSRYLGPQDDKKAWGMGQILTVLYSKPMQRAKYFCTGTLDDDALYRHYALSVALYTHFTSPIRRYADIIVHRQLAASLGVGPVSDRDKFTIQEQAMRCNERKEAAKKVSDMSAEMFFAIFVRECGPLEEDAMVMQVLDRSIDVLVLSLGVVKRVYCNALPLKSFKFQKQGKQGKLVIVWETDDQHPNEETQILQLFSLVQVELTAAKEPLKFTANMKRPETV